MRLRREAEIEKINNCRETITISKINIALRESYVTAFSRFWIQNIRVSLIEVRQQVQSGTSDDKVVVQLQR